MTYSRSSAEKTSRLPSGETDGSRTWRSRMSPVSTGVATCTSGPSSSRTGATKGISVAAWVARSTRQMRPPQVVMNARLSGVNEAPGIRSRVKRDSWSSRCTGYLSQRSSPDSRSRSRSPVSASCRMAYTSQRPSGERAGRMALP